ncbi:MAG: hypothetical protein ACYDAG_11195 [Chloroflexota bacterium]
MRKSIGEIGPDVAGLGFTTLRLDRQGLGVALGDLDAVFAHELVHISRRDYLIRWWARLLRDMTIYLRSSWYALRAMETEEELRADAEAVNVTRRPLAMASALGKIWRAAAASWLGRYARLRRRQPGSH